MPPTEEQIPSRQSADTLLGLTPKETWEPSESIGKNWPDRIKEQALFSARTTSRAYLESVRRRLAEVASRAVIPDVAESALRAALKDLGYRPETGFPDNDGLVPPATPGSVTDLSSSRRIGLVIDTNVKQARSMAQLASSENPVFLMANPAWRLTRTGARKKPRGDWRKRWEAAGNAVGWQGAARRQLVALKTSPIWRAIGDGAGGFTDTLSSAFPPFAFGSGMAWANVGRREWKRICEAEGIDDGLDGIRQRADFASRAGTGQDGVPPQGGTVPRPTGVKGVRTPPRARYAADTDARDAAYAEIRRAIAEATLAEAEIRNGLSRIEKAKRVRAGELADAYAVLEEVAKRVRELEKARSDIAGVRARMDGYAQDLKAAPLPSERAAQAAYDDRAKRLRDAARRTKAIIAKTRVSVAARVKACAAALSGDITEG